MRRKVLIFCVLILTLSLSFSCKKSIVPKAGEASVDDMLRLLPVDARGMVFFNIHKIVETKFFTDATSGESEDAQKYQKFIQKWGINPKKDVYLMAVAITGEVGPQKETEMVAVANLKYDKNVILNNLKEEGVKLDEEDYNGITVYSGIEEKKEKMKMAFLSEAVIAIGTDAPLKSVITLSQGKGDCIKKNTQLMAIVKNVNQEAFLWGALLIPKKMLEKATEENPQAKMFENIQAASFSVHYDNLKYLVDVKLLNEDEAQNKQIVDFMNGIKAVIAMGKSQDPDIQALLNNISITSAATGINFRMELTEELIMKLREKSKKG